VASRAEAAWRQTHGGEATKDPDENETAPQ
jgi:hypothetical protein